MGLIATQSEEAQSLQGLHLFFAAQSNCSSRVRLLLAEKGLAWTGHHLDLLKRENVDSAYFAINPRGLVPALVHDGQVVIESGDIMLYLEEHFPEPGLSPDDPAHQAAMTDWVLRAARDHVPTVKTYAYIKRNAKAAAKTPEEVALYYQLQTDREMIDFHSKHDLPGQGFTDEDERRAVALIEAIFARMAREIGRSGWLAGPAYSLADMAWATSIRTLALAGYPLEEHPVVMDWFARIEARPAWQEIAKLWAEPPQWRMQDMRAFRPAAV